MFGKYVNYKTMSNNGIESFCALDRLIRGLRAMTRWGTGPSGGGGCLDLYSQGQAEAEARMRKELQRLLKEFDSAKVADEASVKMKTPRTKSRIVYGATLPLQENNGLDEGMKRFAKKWFDSDEL
jgi:hypothetical protein